MPYFQAGLEANEYCVWVTSAPLGVIGPPFSLVDIGTLLNRRSARTAFGREDAAAAMW